MGFYILLLSVGVNVNKHYCAGELEKIAFFTTHQQSCCDSDKNPDCCKSENIKISLKESFNLSHNNYTINSSFTFLKFIFYPQLIINIVEPVSEYNVTYIPPPNLEYKHALHILFLSLLI
jgi:hypothetical protein